MTKRKESQVEDPLSLQSESLTDFEILELLKSKVYDVDLVTGKVYGLSRGSPVEIKQEIGGKDSNYLGVRIKYKRKRRKIAVHVLVWMAGTLSIRPPKWQVHHIDEDPLNNAFSNLACLHPIDHLKFHERDEVPF